MNNAFGWLAVAMTFWSLGAGAMPASKTHGGPISRLREAPAFGPGLQVDFEAEPAISVPPGELSSEVDIAIARGVEYLLPRQYADGSWRMAGHEKYTGGTTDLRRRAARFTADVHRSSGLCSAH